MRTRCGQRRGGGPRWAAQWSHGHSARGQQCLQVLRALPGHCMGTDGPSLRQWKVLESSVSSISKVAQMVVMKHDPSFCFKRKDLPGQHLQPHLGKGLLLQKKKEEKKN